MTFSYKPKRPGDALRSEDWNIAMQEIERLEKAKINRDGADTLKGTLNVNELLTINGKVGIGTTAIPAEKLEVGGGIRATTLLAENAIFSLGLTTRGGVQARNLSLQGDGANNIEFAATTKSKVVWNSKVNTGSDQAFFLFKDNSNFVATGTENVRFSIGVFNDFGLSPTYADALDIQGGAQLTLNAGLWDAELNTEIGTPLTGDGFRGISFRIHNAEKMVISKEGFVGIGRPNPRSALDTGTGVLSGAANDYQKAQHTMSGGGTVTWGGAGGRLKWTNRFIAISMERSSTFSEGYLDIYQPTSDIPANFVYDGVVRSANADGVVLTAWEALYAVHTPGGNQGGISYRVVRYTHAFDAPSNWLLVAVVNGDDNTVKLGTGVIVSARSSSSRGSSLPTGTILMWSGNADAIPDGWGLCNGANGTPDLRSRFIVGAGAGGSPPYNPREAGEPDQHNHNLDIPPQSFGTTASGNHSHVVSGTWYTRKISVGSGGYTMLDTGGQDVTNQVRTWDDGAHSHAVTVDYGPLPTTASGDNNRPKWYALCFIMKL